MKKLRWVCGHLEELLMMLLLALIVFVMFAQVIMRYGFSNSLSWSEELSRYAFIWFTFLGISYSIRNRSHIRIDILETFFPVLKKPFEYIGDAFFLAFSIYMLTPARKTLELLWSSKQTSPAMEFPMFYTYLSLLVGLLLIIVRLAEKYILKLLAVKNRKRKVGEA